MGRLAVPADGQRLLPGRQDRSTARGLVELDVLSFEAPATGGDFTGQLAERDRLGQALGRLPVDQRAVMVLHFFLDLPLTEGAATILDIPVGTAKSRLHRGLETLRTAMTDGGRRAGGRAPGERMP